MPKGQENPNRINRELKYDDLKRRLVAAFDHFSELSLKAQHAILERISALRQEAGKKPEELVEEARILTGVYKMVERDITKAGRAANSRAAEEFNGRGGGLPGGPRDMTRKQTDEMLKVYTAEEIKHILNEEAETSELREMEDDIVDVLSEIEESIESHRVGGSQRGSKISEKRSGDFAYRAKGDNAKPIAKDFPKDTIRRPDEAGLKERRDD